MKTERFVFIDGLRAIAALSVVFFHAIAGEHIPNLFGSAPSWLQTVLLHGDVGVAIFFVLSGFVIAHSLRGDRMSSAGDLGRFMLRRSLRLDPPYWVAIAIAIGFSVLASAVIKGRAAETFTAPQILAHILYLQDMLGFKNINPVFWTLCFEIQFYLVFALLLLTRSKIALYAAIVLSVPLSIFPIYGGLFTSLWYGFLLGVAAYSGRPWFWVYAASLGLIGLYRGDAFMLACVATSVMLFTVSLTRLDWRWLQFLGAISYSLYLIHNPITGAVFRVGYMVTGRSMATEAFWWITSIATSIFAAWLLYILVERPSIRLARIAVEPRKVAYEGH